MQLHDISSALPPTPPAALSDPPLTQSTHFFPTNNLDFLDYTTPEVAELLVTGDWLQSTTNDLAMIVN